MDAATSVTNVSATTDAIIDMGIKSLRQSQRKSPHVQCKAALNHVMVVLRMLLSAIKNAAIYGMRRKLQAAIWGAVRRKNNKNKTNERPSKPS